MAKAIESQGVTLAVSSGSPTTFANIGNITAIKGPGGAAAVIDITNLDSSAKEKMMGLPDEGQITVDINYDPDNVQHTLLRTARRARTRLEFRLTLTDTTNTVLTFFGYCIGFSIDAGVDAAVKAAITIEVDGPVTEA